MENGIPHLVCDWTTGWEIREPNLGTRKAYVFCPKVQTLSEAHPASY